MIRINLVPQEILDKELQKQRAVQIGVAVGFVVLIFAGISFVHYYKGVKLAGHLAEQEEKFKKLETIVKQVEALEAQALAVRSRLNVMQDLLKARPLYPRFMTALLKTLPDGIWLKTMTTGGSAQALDVDMSAQALTVENASDWLRRLEASDIFSGAVLGALQVSSADGSLAFSMRVTYKAKEEEKK
ncbi:MAG: PilN domain-containing protein [Elusimicrobiota bacterium]